MSKKVFWDKISPIYDLFETIYNRKVFTGTGAKVAEMIEPSDNVLECACGTGAISIYIAEKCKSLIATDFAEGMLKQASKKCRLFKNVTFQKADITKLEFADASFDKVVAGNVIHLLPEPEKALSELKRVTKPGGTIIIPTYINMSKGSGTAAVKFIELLGANFKRQFDFESYKQFFADMGYTGVTYEVVDGRMPCALAVIKN
jgi:ubiquinone/menaquinone biosynthesis C-methylase UbiE